MDCLYVHITYNVRLTMIAETGVYIITTTPRKGVLKGPSGSVDGPKQSRMDGYVHTIRRKDEIHRA